MIDLNIHSHTSSDSSSSISSDSEDVEIRKAGGRVVDIKAIVKLLKREANGNLDHVFNH